jgi:hypothetical protein
VNSLRIEIKGADHMNDKQLVSLTFFQRISGAGWLIGLLLMISSIAVSGITREYTLNIGIGFAVASTFLFLAGLGISLMSELQRKAHL